MNEKMTVPQALQILDSATHPANAGKLNRADYANINVALQTLAEFVDAHSPKKEESPPAP